MQNNWRALAEEVLFERSHRWETTSSTGKMNLGRGWTVKVEELRNGDAMMGQFNASPEQVRGLTSALFQVAKESGFHIVVDAQPAKAPRIAISDETFEKYTAALATRGKPSPRDFYGEPITPSV